MPLSESEIGNVHEGQIATVTIEALNRKVAAHVSNVGQVPTSSSGAVSYDVTFQLDQGAEGLKVGMSATAEVVVHQAEGVNVPTSAIKADTVTIVKDGKHVTQRVTTGLAGNSSTIVLSGLNAGEEVLLPSVSTSGSSTSLTSKLGSRLGRTGGLGGGGFAGGGAASPAEGLRDVALGPQTDPAAARSRAAARRTRRPAAPRGSTPATRDHPPRRLEDLRARTDPGAGPAPRDPSDRPR